MHDGIVRWLANGENVVLACSALKRNYRRMLCIDPRVKLIYLKGSFELISERVRDGRGISRRRLSQPIRGLGRAGRCHHA